MTARERAITTFLAVGFALVAASVLVMPAWPEAFLAHSGVPRVASSRVTTLPVALGDLLGPPGGLVALALIIGALVAATRFRADGEAYLAVWLAVSFLAAPYAWSSDQLVLLVPLAIATGVGPVAAGDARSSRP